MKDRIKAIVRVVLDVEADSVWRSDTTFEQIAKQAEDSVKGLLTNDNELSLKQIPHRIQSFKVMEVRIIKAIS